MASDEERDHYVLTTSHRPGIGNWRPNTSFSAACRSFLKYQNYYCFYCQKIRTFYRKLISPSLYLYLLPIEGASYEWGLAVACMGKLCVNSSSGVEIKMHCILSSLLHLILGHYFSVLCHHSMMIIWALWTLCSLLWFAFQKSRL